MNDNKNICISYTTIYLNTTKFVTFQNFWTSTRYYITQFNFVPTFSQPIYTYMYVCIYMCVCARAGVVYTYTQYTHPHTHICILRLWFTMTRNITRWEKYSKRLNYIKLSIIDDYSFLSYLRSINYSFPYHVRSIVDEECIYYTNVQQKCIFYEYD